MLGWAPPIREEKVIRWPYLSVATVPIHERDVAAVAVRVLSEESRAGAAYVLTGPESLSQLKPISTIGRVIGCSLRIQEMSRDEARREWAEFMPASMVEMLLNAWAAAIGLPAHVTLTVAEVTGVPARTFCDWAVDQAAEFAR